MYYWIIIQTQNYKIKNRGWHYIKTFFSDFLPNMFLGLKTQRKHEIEKQMEVIR